MRRFCWIHSRCTPFAWPLKRGAVLLYRISQAKFYGNYWQSLWRKTMERNTKHSFVIFLFIFFQVLGFFFQRVYFIQKENEISKESYSQGYDDGAVHSGFDEIEDAIKQMAYYDGFNDAIEANSSYSDGYAAGWQDGQDDLEDDYVYSLGFDAGFDAGYEALKEENDRPNWFLKTFDFFQVIIPTLIVTGLLYLICENILYCFADFIQEHKKKKAPSTVNTSDN